MVRKLKVLSQRDQKFKLTQINRIVCLNNPLNGDCRRRINYLPTFFSARGQPHSQRGYKPSTLVRAILAYRYSGLLKLQSNT